MTQSPAIAEITRRLVDYYQPERIYLFGSAARGDGGPDSDLDFCVVLPDDAPTSLYGPGVHRALWDLGTAADVVRWPAGDFDMRAANVKAPLPATIARAKEKCSMTLEESRRDEAARWLAQTRMDLNTAPLLATSEPLHSAARVVEAVGSLLAQPRS